MKKMSFYLPLAALALAACSNEEVVNEAKQNAAVNADQLQIVPVVTGTTRATSTTTATLSAFQVYIDGKFQKGEEDATLWDNQVRTITKSGASWNFPSGVAYWWADKSSTAKFTAVAPAILNEKTTTSTPQEASITVENGIADQVDYLVAYNEGVREDFDAGVPMNFQHVMSQIVVKALNKSTSDIEVKVAGIKLVNAKSQNTLTFPTSSTASGTFDWAGYTPWKNAATTSATYSTLTSESVSATGTALSGTASNLADPMLLMPQQLVAQDLTATSNLTNNYLAVLVKVTGGTVGYRDADGYYYTTDNHKIAFTARRDKTEITESNPADTYTADEVKALSAGKTPKNEGTTTTKMKTVAEGESYESVELDYDIAIKTEVETIYPREGYGTSSTNFAYVGVALDQLWKPGYKYTYTLNFSKDGIGKSIADQPDDAPATGNFPYGLDFETGETNKPGEDIVDNPTQLFFTVTVDEWIDADAINKDM